MTRPAALTAFAQCARCGWTIHREVTAATAVLVVREISRLVSEHARIVHPGTVLATVLLDTFPGEES
jgi:hypothetical protein